MTYRCVPIGGDQRVPVPITGSSVLEAVGKLINKDFFNYFLFFKNNKLYKNTQQSQAF